MRLKCNKSCCWIHERTRKLSEGHSPSSDSAMSYSESPNIKLEAEMSQLGLSEECPSVQEWNSHCQQPHQAPSHRMREGGAGGGVRGGAAPRDCEGENDCDCADCSASSVHGGSPAYPWSYPPNQTFGAPYGGWYDGSENQSYDGSNWNNPSAMAGYAGPTPGMNWAGGYGPGGMTANAMRPPDMPTNSPNPWNTSPPAGPDGFAAQGSFGPSPGEHFMGRSGNFKGKNGTTADGHKSDDDSEDEHTNSWPIIPRLLTRYKRLKGKVERASGPKKAKLQQKMQLLARKLAVAQRQYSYRPASATAPFPPPMMLGYPGYWGQPPPHMMMMMYGAPYGPPMGYPTISPVRAKFLRRIAALRSNGLLFNFKYWKDWWMRNFGPVKRADGTYNWRAWRKFWSNHFSGGASENADSRPPLASAAPSTATSPAASDTTMKDLQNDQHVGSPQEGKVKDGPPEDVDDSSAFTPRWFQMMGSSQTGSSTAAGPPWFDPQMVGSNPSAALPSVPITDLPTDDEQPIFTEFLTTVKQNADKWNKVKEQYSQEEDVKAPKCDHCGAVKRQLDST